MMEQKYLEDWIKAARAAGYKYRQVSTDPRVLHLAQLGPAIMVGRTMRVAGEDAHITDTILETVVYRHPAADNEQ